MFAVFVSTAYWMYRRHIEWEFRKELSSPQKYDIATALDGKYDLATAALSVIEQYTSAALINLKVSKFVLSSQIHVLQLQLKQWNQIKKLGTKT